MSTSVIRELARTRLKARMKFDDENPSLDGTDIRLRYCSMEQIVDFDLTVKRVRPETVANRVDIPKILRLIDEKDSRFSTPSKLLSERERSSSRGNVLQTAISSFVLSQEPTILRKQHRANGAGTTSTDGSTSPTTDRRSNEGFKRKVPPFLKEGVNDHRFLQVMDIEQLRVQEEVAQTLKRAEIGNKALLQENRKKIHQLVSGRVLIHLKDDLNRVEKWKLLRGCVEKAPKATSLAHAEPELELTNRFLSEQKSIWRDRSSKQRLQRIKSKVACCLYQHARKNTVLSVKVKRSSLTSAYP